MSKQWVPMERGKYVPFLTTMFFFIFFSNIFEVIPFIQFPANARMAVPIAMALMVWVIYNFLGVKNQGFFGYIKNSLFLQASPKRFSYNGHTYRVLLIFVIIRTTFVSDSVVGQHGSWPPPSRNVCCSLQLRCGTALMSVQCSTGCSR